MKRLFLIGVVLLFTSVNAQKIHYVDSDYILEKMPDYKRAQESLKSQTKRWQEEVIKKQEELDQLLLEFENEKILLTDEQIEHREIKISEEKAKLAEMTEERFGPTGLLIRLRKNLVKPIQDRIAIAVRKIAKKEKIGFVFDKSSDLIMLYSDTRYDLSDKVLKELNLTDSDKEKRQKNKPKKRRK